MSVCQLKISRVECLCGSGRAGATWGMWGGWVEGGMPVRVRRWQVQRNVPEKRSRCVPCQPVGWP